MPAPAAIKPSAMAAALMRLTVGSSQPGIDRPARLAARPAAVARINGLRSRAAPKCAPDSRAIGQTAATLKMGTQKPISTATISSPGGPATRSTRASAMKELKRNAICALAAWSRRSMWRPIHGRWGRA